MGIHADFNPLGISFYKAPITKMPSGYKQVVGLQYTGGASGTSQNGTGIWIVSGNNFWDYVSVSDTLKVEARFRVNKKIAGKSSGIFGVMDSTGWGGTPIWGYAVWLPANEESLYARLGDKEIHIPGNFVGTDCHFIFDAVAGTFTLNGVVYTFGEHTYKPEGFTGRSTFFEVNQGGYNVGKAFMTLYWAKVWKDDVWVCTCIPCKTTAGTPGLMCFNPYKNQSAGDGVGMTNYGVVLP